MKVGIVGYDPGTTKAIAFLSLDLSNIFIFSARHLSEADILSLLSDYYVVALTTDKKTPPQAVKNIATSLGAKLLSPRYDIDLSSKRKLIGELASLNNNFIVSNQHEIDALSSAFLCYKSFIKKKYIKLNNLIENEKIKLCEKDIFSIFREILDSTNIKVALMHLKSNLASKNKTKTQKSVVLKNTITTSDIKDISNNKKILNKLNYELRVRDRAINLLKEHIKFLRMRINSKTSHATNRYVKDNSHLNNMASKQTSQLLLKIKNLNKQIDELFDIIRDKDKEIAKLREELSKYRAVYRAILSYKNARKRASR